MNNARIRQVLDRLGLPWPDGGLAADTDLIERLQPHLDELAEADRALAGAERSLERADSRELILSRDLATFEEHRAGLAQRVMENAHQAFRQKSARQEAELRGVTRELGQELQEFGERLAGRRGDLTAPQAEPDWPAKEARLRPGRDDRLVLRRSGGPYT